MFDTKKAYTSKEDRIHRFHCYYSVGAEIVDGKTPEYIVIGAQEPNSSMYADRMGQWDYEKYKQSKLKIFGDVSDYFENRTLEQIEKFICEYLGKDVELYSMIISENVSSGYPVYCFRFFDPTKGQK